MVSIIYADREGDNDCDDVCDWKYDVDDDDDDDNTINDDGDDDDDDDDNDVGNNDVANDDYDDNWIFVIFRWMI